MSYKRDMEFFREDSAKARKKLMLAIKITVAVFAALAVALSVFLIIDLSNGAGFNNVDSGEHIDDSEDFDLNNQKNGVSTN